MRAKAFSYNKGMSIDLLLAISTLLITLLSAALVWQLWQNRRLRALLQTRHQFEEMLAEREQIERARQAAQRVETVALFEAEAEPEGPAPLLLELDPIDPNDADEAQPPEVPIPTVRPVVLGVISHKGGTAKTTTAVELARSWADGERRILLVDTSDLQSAGRRLGIAPAEPGQVLATSEPGLFYVAWQPPAWPEAAVWPDAIAHGWHLVIVDTPSLQHPLATQLLPLLDAMILTLCLEPAGVRMLEQGAILLERRLDPRRQRLLGLLVTRFAPQQALQTSLYASLQREYVGILLSELIPEDPCARQQFSAGLAPAAEGPLARAYTQLAGQLDQRLQPLYQRAGDQA